MRILEITKIALESIRANKVRSSLTMLGIIIGITAVIALLSVGQGAQSSILDQVAGLGSNTITIIPVSGGFGSFTSQANISSFLNNKLDYRILEKLENDINFKEIKAFALENSGSFDVSYKSNSSFVTVVGVNADYFDVRSLSVDKGRALSENDDFKFRKYAVMAPDVITKLFGESDPVGKKIDIDGTSYEVVGTVASKNSSFDNRVYIPINTAANYLIGTPNFSQIAVAATDETLLDSLALKIQSTLNDFYHVSDENQAPFSVFTSNDVLSIAASVTTIFTTLLASIAGISLVVGGIGIMNIMLVSVSERTKEIGLRKAVGARQSAILSQFLMEAIVLTFIGGIIGVVLGIILGHLIGSLGNIPVIVSADSLILATSVSISIGLIFGFYPAYTAAKLNPIDALRYE